ncbi:uncharacterized protein LOC111084291, partial [Limulus polyphemus]|uniref:Uncharacterized protein LOC111084291 n=1 Tax=Limulus polyphemus TaxID=6850 RepID=A0ABM1RZE9_LIMPO
MDEHINLNYFIACCAEFLGVILPLGFLHQSGRRCSVAVSSTVSGVLLLSLLSPSLGSKSSKTLFFLSKLTISTCYTILPVWTVEQMPLELQDSGLGLAEVVGHIGPLILPAIMYF